MRKRLVFCCLAATLASACFGGAISVNGTCGLGDCATPDTLNIGSSTAINASFVYTLPNGDMYQISTFFPISNPLSVGLPSLSQSTIIDATYLGNGSAGASSHDILSINLLQNLQANPGFLSIVAGGYPVFGILGGGIAAGSSFTTQSSSGIFVSPILGPFIGPGNVSGVQPSFDNSGTITNPTLDDSQITETFQAGSAVGSFIEFSFVQSVVFNDLQGGPSSDPVVLLGGAPVGGITGTIGGSGSEEYYSFYWPGGALSATASVTGTPNAGASYLFSDGVAGSCSSLASATLNAGDSFSSTISSPTLAPGEYCIGMDANSSGDPGFALTFITPVEGGVPEPGTFALLFAGLAGIGLRIQRKKGEG